ncbi:MAG: YgjP-like metallopeptidase domain-containing protein, partial [Clostridia bacterium]
MTVEILSNGCTEVLMIRKRVKNINLRVSKGRVVCTFPYGVDKKYVRDFLERKSDWITQVSEKQKSQNNYLMDCIRKNDKLQLLGSLYTIVEREDKKNIVEIMGDTILLSVKDINDEELKDRVLGKWWKELAYISFDSLVDKWLM